MTYIHKGVIYTHSYQDLHSLAQRAKPTVTGFGEWRLAIGNRLYHHRSLIFALCNLVAYNPDYTETERALGRQITKLVNAHQHQFDEKLHEITSSAITRIILWLQHTLLGIFGICACCATGRWTDSIETALFETYTQNQYVRTFGHLPTHPPAHPVGTAVRWHPPSP